VPPKAIEWEEGGVEVSIYMYLMGGATDSSVDYHGHMYCHSTANYYMYTSWLSTKKSYEN
jgi:hypothetical protein